MSSEERPTRESSLAASGRIGDLGDGEQGGVSETIAPQQPTSDSVGERRGGGRRRRRNKSGSFWRELPVLIVIALALALVIKTFIVQAFFIPSQSMEDTLRVGDRVLVNKLVYHTRGIHRGDIVVFNGLDSWDPEVQVSESSNPIARFFQSIASAFGVAPGERDYIKRVIGLPGDHVKCCDAQGRITVNGVPLDEKSYLYPGNSPSKPFDAGTIPPGRLWVMGDHREVSYDSRQHVGDPGGGTIPEDKVIGRAFVVVWPLSRAKVLSIPGTFQQAAFKAAPTPEAPGVPAVLGLAAAAPLTLAWSRACVAWRRRQRRRGARGR